MKDTRCIAGTAIFWLLAYGFSFSAYAAELRILNLDDKGHSAQIEILGEISKTDVIGFKTFVGTYRKSFNVVAVRLNSPGGDVMAALEIGEIIRKEWIWTIASDDPGTQCASACVLILAAGAVRIAGSNSNIAIHRPRFDEKIFAGMDRDQARTKYDQLTHHVGAYLAKMGMSQQLFTEMMRIPSRKIRRLSYDDMKKFGLVGSDPGYDEWTRAKNVERFGAEGIKVFDVWLERSLAYMRQCMASGRDQMECAAETDRRFPNPMKAK